MLYITLLDQFHPGIYSSQVIDVCDHLNKKYRANIRLVAFLSIRELLKTDARKKIIQLSPSAIILPAFPGLRFFELTSVFLFLFCLFTGERKVICRNVFCTWMALKVKKWGMIKTVVFDGRSAMAAEISEYDVFPVDYLRKNVKLFEYHAVNDSDFRMSVSNELINYWNDNYNYSGINHIVIPCTLYEKYFFKNKFEFNKEALKIRENFGFKDDDIVLVYAGSTAPWQSFDLLEGMLTPLLQNDKRIKVLFLSKKNKENTQFQLKFPDNIFIKWVEHKDVLTYLKCCDYGILLRDKSDTNKVASPTKFAEYLYSGLPVLISENLGDFSSYVVKNSCGFVLKENIKDWSFLKKVNLPKKEHCFELACSNFMKESDNNENSYQKLNNFLLK